MTAARDDADEAVRETAVWALGQSGDAAAADGLGEVIAREQSAKVRGTAAWALAEVGARKAPAALIAALKDDDPAVRLKTAWALSEIRDEAAIPALRTALDREQDSRARRAEIRGLIRSGERSDRLTELLESKDPKVREAAIRGIAGHGGVDPWPWPQPRPRPFPN